MWNEYLKHNDHKNKIIQQMKCIHFKLQMHELSEALKSIWWFAKWARIESQLFKKLSQFSSLKWSNINHMTTTFKKKNRDTVRKVLSLIFLSECQQHHKVIHISDSLIQFTHHRKWSEADNQISKSRQSIRRFRYFKQNALSESCKTDLRIYLIYA